MARPLRSELLTHPRAFAGRVRRRLSNDVSGFLISSGLARGLRLDRTGMTETRVLAVLDALGRAGIPTLLMGGWGVDALVGHQTRRHADLDLICPLDADVGAALEALGFQVTGVDFVPGALFPSRVIMLDRSGLKVDFHPVHLVDQHGSEVNAGGPVPWHDQLRVDPAWGDPFDGSPSFSVEAFVSGSIGGRPVQCLPTEAQVAGRSGYSHRDSDRRDLKRLRALQVPTDGRPYVARRSGEALRLIRGLPRRVLDQGRPGARNRPPSPRSALVLEVPDAAPLLLSAGLPERLHGLPPHVTVLYPFLPPAELTEEVRRRLLEICWSTDPLELRFPEVGWFDRVTHLPVMPADGCLGLLDKISRCWPQARPYDGAFATVVPHLTVAHKYLPERTLSRLEQGLPLTTTVTALTCLTSSEHGWNRVWTMPFRGSGVAPSAPQPSDHAAVDGA